MVPDMEKQARKYYTQETMATKEKSDTMRGKDYECRDCGRGFLIYGEEKKEPACPGCESVSVVPKQAKPLPEWLVRLHNTGSS